MEKRLTGRNAAGRHPRMALVVACNNEAVLKANLLADGELAAKVEVSVQKDAASAGIAYNQGIAETTAEIMVFAHQDLFLPNDWIDGLRTTIDRFEDQGKAWGVLGVYGCDFEGNGRGYLYSTGLGRFVGVPLGGPERVQTLDEVVLVVRRSTGLRFDERLPGFHLYGADICLQAQAMGLPAYVVPLFCLHNSNGIRVLRRDYWEAWWYLRKKWRASLPVATPCMRVTRWGGAALAYLLRHALRPRPQATLGKRVDDPARLCSELVSVAGSQTVSTRTALRGQ